MRTERKRFQSFLLLILCCVLLFTGFGCGGGGGQAAAVDGNNSSGSAVDSPLIFNPFIGKPPAPIIAAANATATSVFLDWTDESNKEDGFYIYRDMVKIGETAHNISQWTDYNVAPATTYVYAVIAYNKEGGNVSPEKIVTTLPLPPSSPSNLIAQADSNGVALSWADNSDNEGGFKITRNGSVIVTVPADLASYVDTSVIAGTNYCYQITAFNAGGASPATQQQCVTVPYPNQAPTVKILYPLEGELVYGLTRVQLQWSDPDDANLSVRILVNGEEKLITTVNTSSSSISKKWFEVDFAGLFDGGYQIAAEVKDSRGATTQAQVNVRINAVELEKKAVEFIIPRNSLYASDESYHITRWQSLPIKILVNPILGQEGFDAVMRITDYFTRTLGIPYIVEWGSETIVFSDCVYDTWLPPPDDPNKQVVVIQPNTIPCGKIAAGFADIVGYYQYTIVGPAVIDIAPDFITSFGASSETFEHLVAHEISHQLPVWGHRDTEDITNKYTVAYRIPPEMTRAFQIIYFEIQPGGIIDPTQYGLVCPSMYNCYIP